MTSEKILLTDGVQFARAVRALAHQARGILIRPAEESDVRELLLTIESLEEEARARRSEALVRWLVSLRRRIEDHAMAAV